MKKLCTVLLAFWLAAWTVVPSPDSSLQNPAAPLEITQIPPAPSMTPAITLTPSSVPTASATLAPPQMAETLIIPTPQVGTPVKLLSSKMIDAQIGWAIHEESREILRPGSRTNYPWPPEGYILRTLDGGKTWQNITPPTGAYSPGGLFVLDANTAWASDNLPGSVNPLATRVWHTTAGGQTWQAGHCSIMPDGNIIRTK